MHPHEIHHIKAYVVFFLLSASLIGILVYLYIPIGSKDVLKSSVIQERPVSTTAPVPRKKPIQNIGAPAKTVSAPVSEAESSTIRIRLTKILIRYQKELQTLENQRKASSQGLDAAAEEKIKLLREKIAATEQRITEIK